MKKILVSKTKKSKNLNSKKPERWVVKAGSQMVCAGGPLLLRSWAQQISILSKKNVEIIWVTSGAIATAKEKLGHKNKTELKIHEKQAFSAIGQPIIMDLYNMSFQAEALRGAQILLTYDDLKHSERAQNLKNSIETLLKWKIVPVLNENDAVSTEEIKFGDNDTLSAKVAIHLKADKLIILTDVFGLYDSNPKVNKKAKLIPEITVFSKKILETQGLKTTSGRGTGGMYSKILAAKLAYKNGIDTHLVKGDQPQVLIDILNKIKVGTHVKSRKN